MKNTLVIMGSHPRTRGDFDWSRTDCDVLVFNEAMKMDWVKHADYVMQLHLPVIWRNPGNRNDANHYTWLKSGKTPIIWMQEQYDDVPMSKRYPIEDVLKLGTRYLTSSAAYSVALGIHLGYERIEVYGCEMETNTEYAHQRPGLAYWLGIAKGAGVDVDFHGRLLDSPLYGYEGDVKFPYAYFAERLEVLEVTTKKAMEEYNAVREASNTIINKFVEDGKEPEKVIQLLQRQAELGAMFGLQDGARQEIFRYRKKADVQKEATGDYLFSRQEFDYSKTSFLKQRDNSIIAAQRLADDCQKAFDHVKDTTNGMKRRSRMPKFMEVVRLYVQESVKVGMFDGAMKENGVFINLLDEYVLMAGGARSQEVILESMNFKVEP